VSDAGFRQKKSEAIAVSVALYMDVHIRRAVTVAFGR
jgi:hypothetical protein